MENVAKSIQERALQIQRGICETVFVSVRGLQFCHTHRPFRGRGSQAGTRRRVRGRFANREPGVSEASDGWVPVPACSTPRRGEVFSSGVPSRRDYNTLYIIIILLYYSMFYYNNIR